MACREYIDRQRKWYLNDEEVDSSILEDLSNLFNSIIKPFDFESYAIENFDGDAISESIPYGDPCCLIIDDRVFMIGEDVANFTEENVRNILELYNWPKERIDNAINKGYEITPDVWDAMCDLPVIYKDKDK